MRSRSVLLPIVGLACLVSSAPLKAQQVQAPAWLMAHVGEGEGQIAGPVLRKARELYLRKVGEGAVRNPCYFAMDATRPNILGDGALGRRFYIVCEAEKSFQAISAGHGSGRNLGGGADFSNDRQCVKNFGNAEDSELTTGGAYTTAETKTSFKGYYRAPANQDAAFTRSFIQFDGEGETANARQRAIGGHAAVVLKGVCLRKNPESPYADRDGYVRFGTLTDYAGGRSNGCTSWSAPDAARIVAMVRDDPTTLYIYPDAQEVDSVARAAAAGHTGAGAYWNAQCLKHIRAPKFWAKERLGPILAAYERAHPAPPPHPAPLCRE